jgi:hypothetical protein
VTRPGHEPIRQRAGIGRARRRPRRLGRALSSSWTSPRLTLQADHNHLVVQAVNPTAAAGAYADQPGWDHSRTGATCRFRSIAGRGLRDQLDRRWENRWANDNDGYALAAHPGQSQRRPKNNHGLTAHRSNRPAPLRSPKKAPVPGITAHYATRTGVPLKRIFMPRSQPSHAFRASGCDRPHVRSPAMTRGPQRRPLVARAIL